jgi:hypothetical protein
MSSTMPNKKCTPSRVETRRMAIWYANGAAAALARSAATLSQSSAFSHSMVFDSDPTTCSACGGSRMFTIEQGPVGKRNAGALQRVIQGVGSLMTAVRN